MMLPQTSNRYRLTRCGPMITMRHRFYTSYACGQGFESEMITDTQLLELLGLEGYQDVDLPDWMMTELGVLVAKGDVTVDEFVLALQYVLENF